MRLELTAIVPSAIVETLRASWNQEHEEFYEAHPAGTSFGRYAGIVPVLLEDPGFAGYREIKAGFRWSSSGGGDGVHKVVQKKTPNTPIYTAEGEVGVGVIKLHADGRRTMIQPRLQGLGEYLLECSWVEPHLKKQGARGRNNPVIGHVTHYVTERPDAHPLAAHLGEEEAYAEPEVEASGERFKR